MAIRQFSEYWKEHSFGYTNQWVDENPPKALFSGICGSADAFIIAELFQNRNEQIWVFVESAKRGENLVRECASLIGEENVSFFPTRDAIPYNMKSPFGPTTEARFKVLQKLLDGEKGIFVAPQSVLLQKVPPPKQLFNNSIRLEVNNELSIEQLCGWLVDIGFRRETRVDDVGTFSVRGGIVDIYPYVHEHPIRCEFFGDFLESMREFNIFTQKSLKTRQSDVILPMRELYVTPDTVERAIENIFDYCDEHSVDTKIAKTLEHQWQNLADLDGIEWYSHWFETPDTSILDYFKENTLIVWDDIFDWDRRAEEILENYSRHKKRVPESLQPLISNPEQLLMSVDTISEELSLYQTVYIGTEIAQKQYPSYSIACQPQPSFSHTINVLIDDLVSHAQTGAEIIILSPNLGHAERFLELLGEHSSVVTVYVSYLREGFIDKQNNRLLYTDAQLFPSQRKAGKSKKFKSSSEAIAHFDELTPGDYVVHIDHGIAKFTGIERVNVGTGHQDCMVLHYDNRARLYVPVEDFRLVQKYVGKDSLAPSLSRLGTGAWDRLKKKTRESLKEMASELIDLYAKREYLPGVEMNKDTVWQKEFEDAFLYDETEDQLRAIKEIKKDLEDKKPMDRLVCGDVGFGKTEVAMRAAFKAVMSGFQVALLAPTTILVAQHYATLKERMANFPVHIGMLSRFVKAKDQRKTVEEVKEGKIDILVGTHRMFSKDIAFKNLGLLIIDEEQRFGVKHKEKLKQLRSQVNVLSLSATPIPRTLHMSLIGARDLSMIATPPRNRLPIETKVHEYHDEILKTAIEDELERKGQVFVVHNRVKNLYLLSEKIETLIPGASCIVAHGQMDEKELELIMREFIAGRIDILIATTIIENGIDISNVNTIIINRADMLGLSQLYQLRGRVGRSAEQAYAYLLTPPFKSIQEDSLKRLRALEQFTELGSGFQIAMRDLEIRGAGNILGTQQSGAIAAVGFELYCRLLKEAIDEIQGKEKEEEKLEVKIDAECEAYIPAEYVADPSTRVALYQQLSAIDTIADLEEYRKGLSDRFGPLPQSVTTLLLMMLIKLQAAQINCNRISISAPRMLSLYFPTGKKPLKETIEKVITKVTYQFEVINEEPVKLKTTLSTTSIHDQLKETWALFNTILS